MSDNALQDVTINSDEVIEYIGEENLLLIQKKEGFRFGIDALALANFAKIKKGDTICELGCGSAVVSLLLSIRSKCEKIVALDIDNKYCDMAKRSVIINQLENKIDVVCGDVKYSPITLGYSSMNVIVCNPPYFSSGPAGDLALARHEERSTLRDWVKATSSLLENRGRAYFVFTSKRIVELVKEFEANKLFVKKLQFIHHTPSKPPKIFLIEGIKNSNSGTEVLPPLILHDASGNKTDDWLDLYRESSKHQVL